MADRRRRRQPRIADDVMSEGESQEADQLSADSVSVCLLHYCVYLDV